MGGAVTGGEERTEEEKKVIGSRIRSTLSIGPLHLFSRGAPVVVLAGETPSLYIG